MQNVESQWPEQAVIDWQFAILRFAITLNTIDRAAVIDRAKTLDALGAGLSPCSFSFFSKTSEELCDAIAVPNKNNRVTMLRRHLARIEDRRLRRALDAALDLTPAKKPAARSQSRAFLWRGLEPRSSR